MSTLAWIILAFVAGVTVASIVSVIISARKHGEPTEDIWTKIRPILSEVIIEAIKIYQANQMGYDALVEYSVDYVKRKVDNADFLLPEEKEIITKEFIRSVLEPQLKRLWENNLQLLEE